MAETNAFAAAHGLREFSNWSKVWEYPWLHLHGIRDIAWSGKHLVDFGSEISPIPWLLAARGAKVVLVETDPQWVPVWEATRARLGVDVQWQIVESTSVGLPAACADAATSFSVMEHQPDKRAAIDEIARILKPGAPLFLSFDISEPGMGMSFPEWNGRAFTLAEFENTVWLHPAFGNRSRPSWNVADIEPFRAWHLRSAPHHNYVTGAAVLVRR